MSETFNISISKQYKNRIESGYLWVFSNEIDKKNAPNKISYSELYDNKRNFLCKGVYNPHSLIAFRVLSLSKEEKINQEFFINRIKRALEYRKNFCFDIDINYCRIVYGESDLLPGVVIDRYGDVFVIQFFSYAMEIFKEEIVEALIKVFSPLCILVRNDFYQRKLENANEDKEIVYCKYNNFKENTLVKIKHLDCDFLVDVLNGQKTGFYYDQTLNRRYLFNLVKDKTVLDLCCYTGAFSILSAYHGAKKVIGIDSSLNAIELAKENSKINNLNKVVEFINIEVEKFLEFNKEKFDIVIYDPPSFAKSKKDKKSAIKKYNSIVKEILKIIKDGGIFNFSVCSRHIDEAEVQGIVMNSMLKNKQKGFIIYNGMQSLDHPIYSAMIEETKYLKFISVMIKNN